MVAMQYLERKTDNKKNVIKTFGDNVGITDKKVILYDLQTESEMLPDNGYPHSFPRRQEMHYRHPDQRQDLQY